MVIERLAACWPGTPSPHPAYTLCQPGKVAGLVFASLVLGTVPTANAQEIPEIARGQKDSQEPKLQLPVRAAGQNLHPVTVSAVAAQTFMVDLDSISTEPGNLVRYLLVAVSASGARNVSYEGIRCHPLESRVYAYGREDGTWAPAKGDDWKPIGRGPAARRHATLASDYFCRTDGSPKPLQDIRWAIRTDSSSAPRGS